MRAVSSVWPHFRSFLSSHGSALGTRHTLALVEEGEEQHTGGLGSRSIGGGWTQTTVSFPCEAPLLPGRKGNPSAASSGCTGQAAVAQQGTAISKCGDSVSLHSA